MIQVYVTHMHIKIGLAIQDRIWNSLLIEGVAIENVDDFQTKLHTCTFTHS